MKGIKEIGSYDDPESIGYTNWIKTAAGTYFVEVGTGNIVGPYAGDVKPGVIEPEEAGDPDIGFVPEPAEAVED